MYHLNWLLKMKLMLLQLLYTSGIISTDFFCGFRRVAFFEAIFFSTEQFYLEYICRFLTKKTQVQTNCTVQTPFTQKFYKNKNKWPALFYLFLPSNKRYTLFSSRPLTEQPTPVALQIEESRRTNPPYSLMSEFCLA